MSARPLVLAETECSPWRVRLVRTADGTFLIEKALPDAAGGMSWRHHGTMKKYMSALLTVLADELEAK